MAFARDDMVRRGPEKWTYRTTDGLSTVLAAGYFNDVHALLEAGDTIDVSLLSDLLSNPSTTALSHVSLLVSSLSGGTVTTESAAQSSLGLINVRDYGAAGNVTIGSDVQTGAYSNRNASAAITITLPDATVGKYFQFLMENPASEMTISTLGTDTLGYDCSGDAAARVVLTGTGVLTLSCIEADKWTVLSCTAPFHRPFGWARRTIYVDTAGNDANSGLTAGAAKLTLAGAFKITRPGDTITMADGTYAGANNDITWATAPRGAREDWVTIKATNMAQVTITSALSLTPAAAADCEQQLFLRFDGIVWYSTGAAKVINGRKLKFLRCGFRGAPNTGNVSVVNIGGIGSKLYRGCADLLMQDCWVFGQGGRKRIEVYNSERIVLRRCVVRCEGSFSDGTYTGGDIDIYDCSDVEVQNCISVDSLENSGTCEWLSSFHSTSNYRYSENVAFRGCIAVNTEGRGYQIGGLLTDSISAPASPTSVRKAARIRRFVMEDCVAVNCGRTNYADGIFIEAAADAVINNCTVADLKANGGCLVTNSNTQYAMNSKFFNCVTVLDGTGWAATINANCSNTGTLHYANLAASVAAGLTYPFRAEAASTIESGYAGASVLKRIGDDETMWGEPGFRAIGASDGSSDDLWPFPNETTIKTLFSLETARAWTAGADTLTDYLWNALGATGGLP